MDFEYHFLGLNFFVIVLGMKIEFERIVLYNNVLRRGNLMFLYKKQLKISLLLRYIKTKYKGKTISS
jgi:hypothetical protein